jgi:Uma2 family endonuclease
MSHRLPQNTRHHVPIRAPRTYTCASGCSPPLETAMHADLIAPADPLALRDELVRRWNERPYVEDDPNGYELNEFGEWVVSPRPTSGHQQVASVVAFQLTTQLGERAVVEVSVYTDRGIRVPDVVWMPAARWLEAKGQNPLPFVPDVCVEVVSPGNTSREILMKVGAYLRGGAREAIVVGLKGEVEFFGPGGKLEASALGIRLELPAELF